MLRIEVSADTQEELAALLRAIAQGLDPVAVDAPAVPARELLPKDLSRAGVNAGRRSPFAKHTDEEVLAIARVAARRGLKPAAREFGVSPQWLNAVMAGKLYGRLQPQILAAVREEQARA